MPLVLIVPTVALPPRIPFTLQFTAVFVELLTVAVNVCGSPSSTEAEAGVRLTVTPEGGGCDGARTNDSATAQERRSEKRCGAPAKRNIRQTAASAKFRASFHAPTDCTRCASAGHWQKSTLCT